jgi:hypothetical protein
MPAITPPTYTLVTVPEVIDALGLPAELIGDANSVIGSAIRRATVRLENYLKTPLTPQRVEDLFFVDPSDSTKVEDRFFRFRLSNGAIRHDEPVLITQSSSRSGTFTTVSETDWLIDREKGLLQVADTVFGEADFLQHPRRNCGGQVWVKVVYASGFVAADDIPDEITQALLVQVPLLVFSSATMTQEPAQQLAQTKKAATMDGLTEDMVQSYRRFFGNCMKPVYCVRDNYP